MKYRFKHTLEQNEFEITFWIIASYLIIITKQIFHDFFFLYYHKLFTRGELNIMHMVHISWRLMRWNNFFIIYYQFQTTSKCMNFYQAQYISVTTEINKMVKKKIKETFFTRFFSFYWYHCFESTFQFRLELKNCSFAVTQPWFGE